MDEGLIKHCKETLKKNNLEPIKKLGKGGFGIVFLVSKASYESQLYSVKCTNKKQFVKKPLLRRYLKQEISIMEGLEHQNIVKLVRTFQDDGWIFMVMEYCDLGNISSIQTEKKQGIFTFQQCITITHEVINGLSYMHKHDILHRDIKPENILQMKTKKGIITKICDLGFSRQAKQQQVNTFCGTTYYMAPEIFQKKQYDWKVDVWALGVLIYSMLFGCVPFKGINMSMEIKNKCQFGFDLHKRKLKHNSSISKEKMGLLQNVFAGIFEINPQKRWCMNRIMQTLTQKKIICQPEVRKLHKMKTMETDNTDNNSEEDSPQPSSFEMDEVWFVQAVLDQVSQIQYLDPMEFLALKFYLDRVCLSILNPTKETKKKTGQEKNMIDKLKDSQKRQTHILSENIRSCGIPKLKETYSGKSSSTFQDYKEEYRLVVGHAFYKAHKCIKDYELKMKIKLKLFCCHVINRVFEKEYRRDLFGHYFRWLQKKSKEQVFELRKFSQWIKEDEVQNIIDTVEIINNKFYRKAIH